MANMSFNTI